MATLLTKVVDGPEDDGSVTVATADDGKIHRVSVSGTVAGLLEIRFQGHSEYEPVTRLDATIPSKLKWQDYASEADVLRFTPDHFDGRATWEVF